MTLRLRCCRAVVQRLWSWSYIMRGSAPRCQVVGEIPIDRLTETRHLDQAANAARLGKARHPGPRLQS